MGDKIFAAHDETRKKLQKILCFSNCIQYKMTVLLFYFGTLKLQFLMEPLGFFRKDDDKWW